MSRTRFKLSLLAGASIGAATLITATPSIAQTELVDDESVSDVVTVTATRREEGLQEVPVAVSVIGQDTIETLKPVNLQDFDGLAPNVHIGQAGATPNGSAIFIRGLGYQDVEKTQNPPVGVMVDGVVLGTNTGQIVDAFDVDQIEISRGPQGIFFGKNTTGGVINVQRSKPTREFGGRFSASVGSDDLYILKGIVNVPLGEKGGLKVGGTYRDFAGYLTNVFTGDDTGGEEYWAVTASLDYDVTEWFNAR
ncbi:MAG: TonB-dependent receptor plug domain-containing protein, partial [Pseudomonadota bacterium]